MAFKSKTWVFLGMIGLGVAQEYAPQQSDTLESGIDLTFVANEGVLIQTATKTVLIDALFTDPNPEYAAPPPEVLQNMEFGRAPFDKVDLVLVTHNHPDHLSPSFAGLFLVNNTQSALIAPEDAVAAIRDSVPDWSVISDRVIAITLEPGSSIERAVGDITVHMYRTLHSGGREAPQNLMYLVEMDGRTIFHEGDSDANPDTFSSFGLGEVHIDLALVHFWFPTNQNGEGIIKGILDPDHVGLFHLPIRLMDDAPTTIGQVSNAYDDMFLLVNSGERRTFP